MASLVINIHHDFSRMRIIPVLVMSNSDCPARRPQSIHGEFEKHGTSDPNSKTWKKGSLCPVISSSHTELDLSLNDGSVNILTTWSKLIRRSALRGGLARTRRRRSTRSLKGRPPQPSVAQSWLLCQMFRIPKGRQKSGLLCEISCFLFFMLATNANKNNQKQGEGPKKHTSRLAVVCRLPVCEVWWRRLLRDSTAMGKNERAKSRLVANNLTGSVLSPV